MPVEAKICGVTRPGDAALAVAKGARWLGVIFAGGPRMIAADRAREIVAAAGPVPVLGVFGDQSADEIVEMVDRVGLAGAQLTAADSGDAAARLHRAGWHAWQVWPVGDGDDLQRFTRWSGVDAVLIEAHAPGGSGGKGIRVPLDVARAARNAVRDVPCVLAGGLQPDTLREAIRVVEPDIVDVSSGVESAPGIKDAERLTRFLEIVRVANAAA
jgi:phosphoribosylanthranilate isomerase